MATELYGNLIDCQWKVRLKITVRIIVCLGLLGQYLASSLIHKLLSHLPHSPLTQSEDTVEKLLWTWTCSTAVKVNCQEHEDDCLL